MLDPNRVSTHLMEIKLLESVSFHSLLRISHFRVCRAPPDDVTNMSRGCCARFRSPSFSRLPGEEHVATEKKFRSQLFVPQPSFLSIRTTDGHRGPERGECSTLRLNRGSAPSDQLSKRAASLLMWLS